ncbi:hypothetical protein DPMN_138837 [Dreissena polymorpha]|uniref:Uncharacterized protein n=1 Tax=Dreissena polymorpha TaxID=45954 RepID=A0A9D4G4K6_DREPO|nr:hypothetical protein DPMN_138837 [Dreissena polymorpha]
MQETPIQSATVPDSLPDRRGTYRRLPDSLRRCLDSPPDRLGTYKRLLDSLRRCQVYLGSCRRPRHSLRRCKDHLGSCMRLPDGARSLQDHQGTFGRIPDSLRRCEDSLGTRWILKDDLRRCQYRLGTCRRLSVFGGARQSLRHVGNFKQIPRQSSTLPEVSQTGGAPAGDFQRVCDGVKTIITQTGDFQTVCDGARQSPRPAGHMQENHIHSATFQDCLGNFWRLPDSL